MPGSTLKSTARKTGSGSHLFRFTEIVHAFWLRNICPTFSRLRFVGAQFSINFTLVGTLMKNQWIHCEEKDALALTESSFICLGSCHFLCSLITRISQAGCTSSAAWYLSTYLQEKGIPWAAFDSGLGLCQAGRALGFQPLYRATTQGSSPVRHLGGCPIYFQRQVSGLNLAF